MRMRLVIILICTITFKTGAVPNILQDTWDILTKFDYTVSKCPELAEPSYTTTNIPHESNCAKFYICQKGKKIEMTCPSPLEFNTKINTCDWPWKANCLLARKGYSNLESTTQIGTIRKKTIECDVEDQHIPHESFCDHYYRCVYGRKVLKICPNDMVFNVELGICDFRYNVICDSTTAPEQLDFLELNVINSTPRNTENEYDYYDDLFDQLNPSEIKCPDVEDSYDNPLLFAHDTKCNAYYRCANGKKMLMFCPGVLRFNSELAVCDWPNRVKCGQRTKPKSTTTTQSSVDRANPCRQVECRDTTVYLPDPKDAGNFFRCERGREIRETCPNGLVFDVELRVCNLRHLARTLFNS